MLKKEEKVSHIYLISSFLLDIPCKIVGIAVKSFCTPCTLALRVHDISSTAYVVVDNLLL